MRMGKLTVTNEFHGQRLDKFLSTHNPDQSRSQLQKMIKQGAVLVNGEKTTVHNFLKKGDRITIQKLKIEPEKKITGKGTSGQVPIFKLEVVADTDIQTYEKLARTQCVQALYTGLTKTCQGFW